MERTKKYLHRLTSILLIVAAAYGGACTVWGDEGCRFNSGNTSFNCSGDESCCSGPDPWICNLCADDEGCEPDGTCINPR